MNKLILGVLLLSFLFVNSASAVSNLYNADRVKVSWDIDTTYTEWISQGQNREIKYNVYQKVIGGSDYVLLTTEAINVNNHTVQFETEGGYILGVSAVKFVDGVSVAESTISWSDNPAVCLNEEDFGIQYYTIPVNPTGLRRE